LRYERDFLHSYFRSPLDSETTSVNTQVTMLRVIKVAIAVAIVVAVVAILVHPYIDGLDSVARKHHAHRVILSALLFFAANRINCHSLVASASPVVQNARPDLLALTCIRLC
jgi:hypothetical protein